MGAVINFPLNPPPVHEAYKHGVQVWAMRHEGGRGHQIGVWMVENPKVPALRVFTSTSKALAYAAALSSLYCGQVYAHGDEARALINLQIK